MHNEKIYDLTRAWGKLLVVGGKLKAESGKIKVITNI